MGNVRGNRTAGRLYERYASTVRNDIEGHLDAPSQGRLVKTSLTNFAARIVADVAENDDVEIRHVFDIEATHNGVTWRFSGAAGSFVVMNWPLEHVGATAVIYPGVGGKDHARAAIQLLSGAILERRVYCHLGWRRLGDRWVYLHADGATGADGPVGGVEVALPEQNAVLGPEPAPGRIALRAAAIAFRGALRAIWALMADADPDRYRLGLDEMTRLIDEVGEPLAPERRRRWERNWWRETERCPRCGEPSALHSEDWP